MNEFLKQIGGGTNLKDYKHASKIFVADNFRLAPKFDFLFHVEFDINPAALPSFTSTSLLEVGMMVKSVNLPKYKVETKTYNAYNRPNIVQTKLSYDPVSITFHDDSADLVRRFWYDYYDYYYRNSDYAQSTYQQPHVYNNRMSQAWGYSPRPNTNGSTTRAINAIKIYSLHRRRFAEYILVNPIITSFQHGEHNTENSGTLSHTMNVEFETVLYQYGWIAPDQNISFATLHYDKTPSPLTPQGGGTDSILGPGGLMSAIDGVANQLGQGNIFGAAFTGFMSYQNLKDVDLKKIASEELKQIGKDIITGNNPLSKIQIPTVGGLLGKANVPNSNPQVFGYGGDNGGAGINTGLGSQIGGIRSPNGATAGVPVSGVANTPVKFDSIDDLLVDIGSRSNTPQYAATITTNGEAVAETFPVNTKNNIRTFELPNTTQGKIQ